MFLHKAAQFTIATGAKNSLFDPDVRAAIRSTACIQLRAADGRVEGRGGGEGG